MVEVLTKEHNGASITSSYSNVSWNSFFFVYNQTLMSMINNGTPSASFTEATINPIVKVSTLMGTFTTDKISTCLNTPSSEHEVMYVDT